MTDEQAEDRLITRQRICELGKRHGHLDAMDGRGLLAIPASVGEQDADIYRQGWAEGRGNVRVRASQMGVDEDAWQAMSRADREAVLNRWKARYGA